MDSTVDTVSSNEIDKQINLIDIESVFEFDQNVLNDSSSVVDRTFFDPKLIETDDTSINQHILYVIVVGFHHKKGCQIDFCYPPMNQSDDFTNECSPTNKLPSIWKTLPSIALPDGAHNFDRDTIYFHLPHPNNTQHTIYGISCYRQISAEKLKEKDDDVTRGTVQKSVVVLSELPLFGLIAVKCELITTLYFKECDFLKTDCLKELYINLNSILTKELMTTSEVFLGLCPRDLILMFSHKIILLFKLILLEKKVLFHKSPVKDLCTSILTLLSLFPGMLEAGGLDYSSTNVQQKKNKDRKFSSDIELIEEELVIVPSDGDDKSNSIMLVDESNKNNISIFYTNNRSLTSDTLSKTSDTSESNSEGTDDKEVIITNKTEPKEDDPFLKYKEEESLNPKHFYLGDENYTPLLFKLSLKDCGFPLNIFRKGSYCHPYLSLAYLDILSDSRVNSIVVGATNYLFKQKRNLFDVIVELDDAKIDIVDTDLKKKLQLSTEDLRFADYLIRCIEENGTKESSKEYNSFNALFMNAWKETQNYKTWSNMKLTAFDTITAGHPFYGQLSINDMKLKFNHVMNTERGKRFVQTGKAVGSALTNAKTAVYGWWSNLGTKNANNLEIDHDLSITTSDTNLSKTPNCNENDHSNSSNKSANKIGLKLSSSFTSFTLSSFIKTSEEAVNSVINSVSNREELDENQVKDVKIETI